MLVSPVIKKLLALASRNGHHIAGQCTDVACPGIDNLEPCQQNRHHDQNGREGNGELGAHRSAITEGKLAIFAG